MPPSLPKSSISSLARYRCSKASIPIRSFTTTPSLSAIGPENPKFIEVPLAPQTQARPKLDIKGTLPPPRNIFPKRGGDKTTAKYLAAVTREPNDQAEPANDYVAWKRRMAASRRENLREGLVELQKRKHRQDSAMAGRSKARSEYREKRLAAPQREDERLTNPTITSSTHTLQSGSVPDPDRALRVAEKVARVQAKETAREEARRDALHTLYMHARSFITTEEQLDAAVERIFTDTPFEKDNLNQNIWDFGVPPTVQDMLSTVNNTQKRAIEFHAGPGAITGKRLKRIAEELTGGKMD